MADMDTTEKTDKSSVGVDPPGGEADGEEMLDPRAIENYRRVLDYAAAVLDGSISPQRALSAGEALFGALSRHDADLATTHEIVRFMAGYVNEYGGETGEDWICQFCQSATLIYGHSEGVTHTSTCPVTKAREIMARLQSHTEVHEDAPTA